MNVNENSILIVASWIELLDEQSLIKLINSINSDKKKQIADIILPRI